MASIRVSVHHGRRRVTVRGQLVAADLRRLESACGPALEYRELPLEIRLRDTGMDEASRQFLDRLVKRGAILA